MVVHILMHMLTCEKQKENVISFKLNGSMIDGVVGQLGSYAKLALIIGKQILILILTLFVC